MKSKLTILLAGLGILAAGGMMAQTTETNIAQVTSTVTVSGTIITSNGTSKLLTTSLGVAKPNKLFLVQSNYQEVLIDTNGTPIATNNFASSEAFYTGKKAPETLYTNLEVMPVPDSPEIEISKGKSGPSTDYSLQVLSYNGDANNNFVVTGIGTTTETVKNQKKGGATITLKMSFSGGSGAGVWGGAPALVTASAQVNGSGTAQ